MIWPFFDIHGDILSRNCIGMDMATFDRKAQALQDSLHQLLRILPFNKNIITAHLRIMWN